MSTHWTRWQFKPKASSSCTLAERKGLLRQVGLCQACCQDEVTADKCHAHTPLVAIICGGNNTNQCCAVAVSVLKVSKYNGLCILLFSSLCIPCYSSNQVFSSKNTSYFNSMSLHTDALSQTVHLKRLLRYGLAHSPSQALTKFVSWYPRSLIRTQSLMGVGVSKWQILNDSMNSSIEAAFSSWLIVIYYFWLQRMHSSTWE